MSFLSYYHRFASILLFLVFSCTTVPNYNKMYEGEERSIDALAFLTCPENIILFVDSAPAKGLSVNLLLPGLHTLYFYYQDQYRDPGTNIKKTIRSKDFIIGFEAKANNEYRINYEWKGDPGSRILTTMLEEKQEEDVWIRIADGYIVEMEVEVQNN
ncbi:MAG: DUF2057 family protein [Candidatus Neomarinimicrobiota bacterium]